MEVFDVPPEIRVKQKTLAETPPNLHGESLKEAIAAPGLDEPIQRKIGLGFSLEESQVSGVDVSNGKGGFLECDDEKQETENEIGLGVDSGQDAELGLGFVSQAEGIEGSRVVNMAAGVQSVKEATVDINEKSELQGGGLSVIDVNKGNSPFEVEVKNVADLGKNGENNYADANLFGNGNWPGSTTGILSDGEDREGKVIDEKNLRFYPGDFVWGKIKSRPWWPGQIYNPSDASDYAAKYKQIDCLLVVYFGDGSFSWCYPSQLEPFVETYESMSKQSDSKIFVDAVQEAVNAIGQSVESEMTCSCIRGENKLSFSKPIGANAAIKGGVLEPDRRLGQLSVVQFEPAQLIADLNDIAKTVSANNMLEFTVLKSRLSAFYLAKGGYQLPMYCIPQPISGLEDKDWTPLMGNDSFVNVSIEGPLEEDWLSSPPGPRYALTSQSSLPERLRISEDELYQRRKQKSMAELLEEAADIEPESEEHDIFHEETGKMVSASIPKFRKDNGEAEIHGANKLTSPARRGRKKKAKSSENGHSGEKGELKKLLVSRGRKRKDSGVRINCGQAIKGTDEGTLLEEWEKNQAPGSEIDSLQSGDAKLENHESFLSRERKKSKYLSPPYTTDLKYYLEYSSLKSDSQTEVLEVSDVATGPLIGSPPIMKCSNETFQKLSNECGVGHDAMENPSSQPWKLDEGKIIDINDARASPNEVLSGLQYAAIGIQGTQDVEYLDIVKGFFSVFRSSIYHDGSYYKVYHKSRRGRKRKSLHPEPRSVLKNMNQTTDDSHEGKIGGSGLNRKKEAKLKMSNLKRAPVASDVKTDDKVDRISASSAVLFVSFPPAVSLPSKDDLIAIYRKFGAIKERETDIIYNSFSGRIVFSRTADAEQAFNHSVKSSPFGAVGVSFRLRYPSAPPRIDEVNEDLHTKISSLPNKGSMALEIASATDSSVKEASQLNFIKQKLEMMTSMLETSDNNMSPTMQSNLQGEMRGLLEKVSVMAKSSEVEV